MDTEELDTSIFENGEEPDEVYNHGDGNITLK